MKNNKSISNGYHKPTAKVLTGEEEPGLLAKLNLTDATLLVMGSVIGSGIFLTTGIIAESLPSAFWILLAWFLGSVISLFGGLTLAELGAMMPEAGGQYIYLRAAYGSLTGFLYGWTTFLVTQTGGIAAMAVGFAEYLSYFVPALGLQHTLFACGGFSISSGQIAAALTIALLTVINYFGIRSGSMVQNFFTLLKIGAIVVLMLAGFYLLFSGSAVTDLSSSASLPPVMKLVSGMGVALIAVLWTFDGWYSVNSVASEIKNVRRNLPLSLILGLIFTGILYVLVNVFYVLVLPLPEMRGVVRIGEKATTFLFGEMYGSAMSGLILVSILGCLSATIIFGPRIFFAMARDRLFFKSFARVHPRYHTPNVAIVWQGIWSGLLCLTGSYEQLYTYVIFTSLMFYIACALAIFVLRKKQPQSVRPYRVWGYPLVPLLFGLAMLLIAINSLFEKPVESLLGIGLMLIGLPVFLFWKNK
jgi:basic amino acid/polyamine antiporter, APA family